jgi:hypothetical protein
VIKILIFFHALAVYLELAWLPNASWTDSPRPGWNRLDGLLGLQFVFSLIFLLFGLSHCRMLIPRLLLLTSCVHVLTYSIHKLSQLLLLARKQTGQYLRSFTTLTVTAVHLSATLTNTAVTGCTLRLKLNLCRIWDSHSGSYECCHHLGYSAV